MVDMPDLVGRSKEFLMKKGSLLGGSLYSQFLHPVAEGVGMHLEYFGGAFFAFGAGEEGDVDAVKGLGGRFLDGVGTAVDVQGPGAARQDAEFLHGKFPLV